VDDVVLLYNVEQFPSLVIIKVSHVLKWLMHLLHFLLMSLACKKIKISASGSPDGGCMIIRHCFGIQ
jgi:hypothetical protein